MMPLEEAQAAVLHAIRRVRETEVIELAQARVRYCAEPLLARVDHPAFDNSSMDGYALNAAEARTRHFTLPVNGVSSCGDAPAALTPGTAMRIFTGAPMPRGADAVVIQEDVQLQGAQARFPQTLEAGQHVRYRGEDFRAGDVLYEPGRQLRSTDLALLATAGLAHVTVYRRPRVLVASTGNELVDLGYALAPGQIYESNGLALVAQLRAVGADVTDAGVVHDDAAALRAVLAKGRDYDFVITTGGASVGDRDLVKQTFAEFGTLQLWKVRIKPGKPLAFGHIGERTHFFALPGNPVSTLVTYKLFIEPAIVAWHHGTPEQWLLDAAAVNAFKRQPGRTEFLRARLFPQDGRLMAQALHGQGSHMVGPLRDTNGFIRVEADSEGFAAGASVKVLLLER